MRNRERGRAPLRYRVRRQFRSPRRLAAILALLAVPALAFCGFSLWRGVQRAQQDVERMRASANKLQQQAGAFDLAGAAVTMTQLRHDADDARATTSGPLWATATIIPVLGDDVSAARTVSSSVAEHPRRRAAARAGAPQAAADEGADRRRRPRGHRRRHAAPLRRRLPGGHERRLLDASGLTPQLADGVRTLSAQLKNVRDPLANAVPGLQVLPAMLGQTNPSSGWSCCSRTPRPAVPAASSARSRSSPRTTASSRSTRPPSVRR